MAIKSFLTVSDGEPSYLSVEVYPEYSECLRAPLTSTASASRITSHTNMLAISCGWVRNKISSCVLPYDKTPPPK